MNSTLLSAIGPIKPWNLDALLGILEQRGPNPLLHRTTRRAALYADEFRIAAAAELATRRATPPR